MSDDPVDPVPVRSWPMRLMQSKVGSVFAIRDFRLLWFGAFISFTGGWVQTVAQGFFVYQLTGEESKLALVNFASNVPVLLFGFVAGSLADSFDKKRLLVLCQALLAIGPGILAWLTFRNEALYWHVLLIAVLLGVVRCVEMPARQSLVGRVVPMDKLATAVPLNALTFNLARIVGPAIGGVLLAQYGVAICYVADAVTYLALIWAAAALRADTSPERSEPQGIKDLVMEGALYTYREPRLKLLLSLETITAIFGIAYVTLIPAYVSQTFGFAIDDPRAKMEIGNAYTAIGVGAVAGLFIAMVVSDSPHRGRSINICMFTLAASLAVMSIAHSPWVAYAALAFSGACTLVQFNTTNALFQILSPPRLRGRVLAMHIWALNGLSPFGILLLGWLATQTRTSPWPYVGSGVDASLKVGALVIAVGAIFGFVNRRVLRDLGPDIGNIAIDGEP